MTATVRVLDEIIDDEHIVVCTGAGGVGKTTVSAAIALRAAERGRRVAVCTIDPAKRLAQAMGLESLDNRPRLVTETRGGGELHALMLDMKRTFDDMLLEITTRERAERIFRNPFYEQLSGTFAGTQEYMAMEKLYGLHDSGRFELIVIDTPPTRSALDFLDGPKRLSDFLEGRLLRMLLLPAMRAGKRGLSVVNFGTRVALKAMTRITGATLLSDIADFLGEFDGMYDEFRKRAQRVRGLLESRHTRFVVVTAPTTSSLREARFFLDRLATDRMPLGGIVLNRAHPVPSLDVPRSASDALARDALRRYDELRDLSEREEDLVARVLAQRAGAPLWRVPDLLEPIVDLDGLRRIAELIAATGDDRR
jgi:anion-transporting  ArsA/GET3 family ATPase